MAKINNLISHINNLDLTQIYVDDENDKMYKEIIVDLDLLNETIVKKGFTDSRKRMFKFIMLIIEIFTGRKLGLFDYYEGSDIPEDEKLDTAGGKDEEPPKDAKTIKGVQLKIMTPSQLFPRLLILLGQKSRQ